MWGLVPPQVCESRAISTMQKVNNGTVSSDFCIVVLCKGITGVILDINTHDCRIQYYIG